MSLTNNLSLAREIETIKRQGTREYINNRKELDPTYNGDSFSLGEKGEVFCLDDYCFGIGFGINKDVLVEDIELIEGFIRKKARCSTLHFETTPFCKQEFLTLLQERGYTLDHFLSVWILNVEEWEQKPSNDASKNDEVSIIEVTAQESYEWARTVALGYSSDSKTTIQEIESVRCFAHLSNTIAFLVKENQESVAGGNLAITGKLGEMFLTSTIKAYRGKGYQNLLIAKRIRYAQSNGCTHLTVTTKPSTTSAKNMERNGFRLMYNKAILKCPSL